MPTWASLLSLALSAVGWPSRLSLGPLRYVGAGNPVEALAGVELHGDGMLSMGRGRWDAATGCCR